MNRKSQLYLAGDVSDPFLAKKEKAKTSKYEKNRVEMEGSRKSPRSADERKKQWPKNENRRRSRRSATCAVMEEEDRFNGKSFSELKERLMIRHLLTNSGLL